MSGHRMGLLFCAVFLLARPAWTQEYERPVRPASDTFSYEDIVKITKSSGARSVDELLPKLPTSFRKRFTLIRNSLSLQKTDALNPRAMMFTDDAKLVCTFGGNTNLEGGNTLECYQYLDKTRTFDFREIDFPDSNLQSAQEVLFSESNQRARGGVSCTGCHGIDPRPNWEGYPNWPGLYGRGDDVIGGNFNSGVDAGEIDDYLKFKKSITLSSRYAQLGFDPGDVYSPYAGSQAAYGEQKQGIEHRPNLLYTLALQELMAERNSRKLAQRGAKIAARFVVDALCLGHTGYVLKNEISVYEWTPYFRTLDPTCANCGVKPVANSTNYDFFSGERPGFSSIIAMKVLRDFKLAGLSRGEMARKLEHANDGAPFCNAVEKALDGVQ